MSKIPKLCKCNIEDEKSPSAYRWYPQAISSFEDFLKIYVDKDVQKINCRNLRKNLAFNMQYLEYLHQTDIELNLSGAIKTINFKSFIIFCSGVIEAILHYCVCKNDLFNTKQCETFSQKEVKHKKFTILIAFKEEIDFKFEGLIKIAKNNKLLGSNDKIYTTLDNLRKLRNKVHIGGGDESDWVTFGNDFDKDKDEGRIKYDMARSALYEVFISLFNPSETEEKKINFLKP